MGQDQILAIIFYEYQLGTNSMVMAEKINKVFDEGTVTDRTVQNWFQRFNNGDTSFKDQFHRDRPPTFDKNALRRELELHPNGSTRDLEKALEYHYSTINRHLQFIELPQISFEVDASSTNVVVIT